MPGWLFSRLYDAARTKEGGRCPRPAMASLTRAERVEMVFAAASQGIGECPTWMLLALEADDASIRADHRNGHQDPGPDDR